MDKLAWRQNVKHAIWDAEFTKNGFYRLSDMGVGVVNLRLNKTTATADIIIYDYDEKRQERYNDCEYPLDKLREGGYLKDGESR